MGCNLRDLAPSQPIDLGELKGEKVAIDVFLNAYQFITSLTGQDGKPLSYNGKPVAHLMGFLDRATIMICLLYTSPSPRDGLLSRMPSSA